MSSTESTGDGARTAPTTLVVDGANVVGSRPDGWWRDRAGAARRLFDRLADAGLPYDRVTLVLEGAAKAGVPAGDDGAVAVVHAPRNGDDEIVGQARSAAADGPVTVATADRELRERVRQVGAEILSPGRLLELIGD